MKFIVTAGGQGTKIWPYSRKNHPKQFQKIIGDESLFTYNINVLLEKYAPEDIFISTKKGYVDLAREQAPQIPDKNYIIEPDVAKNRGPAEGLAFLHLSLKHPDEPFMIIQSDCIRIHSDHYLEMIKEIENIVVKEKKLVTGGITATFPVLGVDYFKLGDALEVDTPLAIHKVDKFIERNNDYKLTKDLVENHDTTTHCNHAAWFPDLMLEAYEKYHPEWHSALMDMKKYIGTEYEHEKVEEIYSRMETGPTEIVTRHVFTDGLLVKLPFDWVDVGTWGSIHEHLSEEGGNYTDGNVVAVDSEGTLVKSANRDKLVAVLGLKDMVVVDTDDVLLIMPKEKTDKIKDIHKELEDQDLHRYL